MDVDGGGLGSSAHPRRDRSYSGRSPAGSPAGFSPPGLSSAEKARRIAANRDLLERDLWKRRERFRSRPSQIELRRSNICNMSCVMGCDGENPPPRRMEGPRVADLLRTMDVPRFRWSIEGSETNHMVEWPPRGGEWSPARETWEAPREDTGLGWTLWGYRGARQARGRPETWLRGATYRCLVRRSAG